MTNDFNEVLAHATRQRKLCERVKNVIVERLDLPLEPSWITNDQPLFGRGLELDSVDALELMVGIESDFGASITDDEMEAFGSVATLIQRIQADPCFTG